MSVPTDLAAIRTKVRKITGRPSSAQLSDSDLDDYINTFYKYDFPEHLRLESLRVNYEFNTRPNIAVYDFPTDSYLTNMPPVYIGGYETYMTQSRTNFFRLNPQLNYIQQSLYTGDGVSTAFSGQLLTSLPAMAGFKPNPPGAYSSSAVASQDIPASDLLWNVIVSASGTPDPTSGIAPDITLVDDGQGNLFSPTDTSTDPVGSRGSVNYITGALDITNMPGVVPSGNAINVQYIRYSASRPQAVVFFQDQFILYPVPDQAYTVSFEVYKYPSLLTSTTQSPQLKEWWQLIALGSSVRIFEDNADFESLAKYFPLFEQQMMLAQRRTIVQQATERTATIYTEQADGLGNFPFGNLFGNF